MNNYKTFIEGRGYIWNFQLLQEREAELDTHVLEKPLDVLFNRKYGKLSGAKEATDHDIVKWKTKKMSFEDIRQEKYKA